MRVSGPVKAHSMGVGPGPGVGCGVKVVSSDYITTISFKIETNCKFLFLFNFSILQMLFPCFFSMPLKINFPNFFPPFNLSSFNLCVKKRISNRLNLIL